MNPQRPPVPDPVASRRSHAAPYEPPRIDRVFTPQDLEREILYAGATDGQLISGPN
jgi:hypothetical protein